MCLTSKQQNLFGESYVLHTHARIKHKANVNRANPPGKSAQARGNNPVMKVPNRLYSRFLLLAVDTIANGPSRVNNPPNSSLGGFTKPPIPKPTSCSDHHDRHKSRYGFCHVLSCLTVLMQCFCLVIFLISTIASFVSVISCNTITKRKCVYNKIVITP
jgi:hypothetical protein